MQFPCNVVEEGEGYKGMKCISGAGRRSNVYHEEGVVTCRSRNEEEATWLIKRTER